MTDSKVGRRGPARPGGWAAGTLPLVGLALGWSWVLAWQATWGAVGFGSPPHVAVWLFAALSSLALAREARPLGTAVLAGLAASLAWDAFRHAGSGPPDPFLSPPHAALALWTLLLLARHGWRAPAGRPPDGVGRGGRALVGALDAGVVLLGFSLLATEYLGRPNLWHGSDFYIAAGAVFPVWLVGASRRSEGRFGATLASLAYPALLLGGYGALLAMVRLFGLEGGTDPWARLALPHLPVMLLVPALAFDLVLGADRTRASRGVRAFLALLLGPTFIILVLGVHWRLGDFLLPRMDAGVLARMWAGEPTPGGWTTQYWTLDPGNRELVEGLAIACAVAALSSGVGLLRRDAGKRPPGPSS